MFRRAAGYMQFAWSLQLTSNRLNSPEHNATADICTH